MKLYLWRKADPMEGHPSVRPSWNREVIPGQGRSHRSQQLHLLLHLLLWPRVEVVGREWKVRLSSCEHWGYENQSVNPPSSSLQAGQEPVHISPRTQALHHLHRWDWLPLWLQERERERGRPQDQDGVPRTDAGWVGEGRLKVWS